MFSDILVYLIRVLWLLPLSIFPNNYFVIVHNIFYLIKIIPQEARHILVLNALILDEYARGSIGMIEKDQHWLVKPTDTILAYDFERKEQWVDTLQLLQSSFKLEHILGHQDNLNAEPLPWKAPLKAHCNAIATTQLESIQNIEKEVLYLLACKVVLSIAGSTVTHHIPNHVWQHYGKHIQTAYLCQHHH
jgi:hypothetical protein